MADEPHFSVIIPVCHGGQLLREALASLRGLDYPPGRFEVVLAAAEDDADAREAVREEGAGAAFALRLVTAEPATRSAKLNRACAVARGDVLVFSDDDCTFPRDWLTRIRGALEREMAVGALGGSDEAEADTALGLALDWALRSFWCTGGCRGGGGFRVGKYYPRLWNMAVPRRVAREAAVAGPEGVPQVFDESLEVHEDVDLGRRVEAAGRRLAFAPDVRVSHKRETTAMELLRRNFRMAQAARRLGVHRTAHRVLAACLAAVVAMAGLSFIAAPLRGVVLACVLLYAAILLTSGVRAGFVNGRPVLVVLVPAVMAGLHLSRALGYVLPGSRGGASGAGAGRSIHGVDAGP